MRDLTVWWFLLATTLTGDAPQPQPPRRPLLPEGPCVATSPSGIRFIFLQPEHSGTDPVIRYLTDRLNVSTCGHEHKLKAAPPDVTYAFAFVRNPFQRILSNAAFRGVISGRIAQGDRGQKRRWEREVASFRRWVAKMEAKGKRPIQDTASLFERAPMLRFVGRTATLARDLKLVLERLSYGPFPGEKLRLPMHCVSSCASVAAGLKRWEAASGDVDPEAKKRVRWYDTNSTRFVLKYYGDDFRGSILHDARSNDHDSDVHWRFSKRPEEMWTSNGGG